MEWIFKQSGIEVIYKFCVSQDEKNLDGKQK